MILHPIVGPVALRFRMLYAGGQLLDGVVTCLTLGFFYTDLALWSARKLAKNRQDLLNAKEQP